MYHKASCKAWISCSKEQCHERQASPLASVLLALGAAPCLPVDISAGTEPSLIICNMPPAAWQIEFSTALRTSTSCPEPILLHTCPAGCLHSALTLEASDSCRATCMAPVNVRKLLQAQVRRRLAWLSDACHSPLKALQRQGTGKAGPEGGWAALAAKTLSCYIPLKDFATICAI